MSDLTDLTEHDLVLALERHLAQTPLPPSVGPLVRRARSRAVARRRRRAGLVAGSAVVALGVAGLLLPRVLGAGPRFDVRGGPAATSSATTPSSSTNSSGDLGFVPGGYGGVIANGLPPTLTITNPVSATPLLPAAVRWGADGPTLLELSDRLYGASRDGSIPDSDPALRDGRNVRWVAFPFPASALMQPSDLGRRQMYLDPRAVQTTGFRVQHDIECEHPGAAWTQHRVAGAVVTLQSSSDAKNSTISVVETIGAFDGAGAGASSAYASAVAAIRCAAPLTRAPLAPVALGQIAAAPGVQAVAGVGRDQITLDLPMESRFLGVARIGDVVVGVDYYTHADLDTARTEGSAALQAAIERLQSQAVRDLVAQYVD